MMKNLLDMWFVLVVLFCDRLVRAEIRDTVMFNKLVKIKPVGSMAVKTFIPLTELPPPHVHSGRKHMEDCTEKEKGIDVYGGPRVAIFGEYYDDREAKTVATVVFPDHIDSKHFEVTTQVPYLTVGPVEALGYHPSTIKSNHPSECEKIYQDHLADQYSDETTDYSEESLEMARMPLGAIGDPAGADVGLSNFYSDLEK